MHPQTFVARIAPPHLDLTCSNGSRTGGSRDIVQVHHFSMKDLSTGMPITTYLLAVLDLSSINRTYGNDASRDPSGYRAHLVPVSRPRLVERGRALVPRNHRLHRCTRLPLPTATGPDESSAQIQHPRASLPASTPDTHRVPRRPATCLLPLGATALSWSRC